MNTFLDKFPPGVDKAVERLVVDMTFADRSRLANMNEAALIRFHETSQIEVYLTNGRVPYRLKTTIDLVESMLAPAVGRV